jgi:hypothetical protein
MVSPRLEREKVSCVRSSNNGEHIVAMFAIGVLLIITVGSTTPVAPSSTYARASSSRGVGHKHTLAAENAEHNL